nr:MAG: replication associated protein [Cressdnaviricota sp.]
MAKFRPWLFTLNNYTDEEVQYIKSIQCVYLIFGYELAPTTNTPHLQGYIYFKSAISFSTAKKRLPRSHVLNANGTPQENKTYCSKSGNFYEVGTLPSPGKRNDILAIKEYVKTPGSNVEGLFEKATSSQSFNFGLKGLQIYTPTRSRKPEVIWCYGPTGSGKSTYARQQLPDAFWKDNLTWDGYIGQETVIWDDFRETDCKLNLLLKYLDKFPCQVNVKFGHQQLLFSCIFITSPFHPKDLCYQREDICQLLRRIDDVIYFLGRD